MFPESAVANEALSVVRKAIAALSAHLGQPAPAWTDFDHSDGWSGRSGPSDSATATLISAGTTLEDPAAVRIYFVRDGIEYLASVHPPGFDHSSEATQLIQAVNVPITAVRVYEGGTLVRQMLVNMRGNA